MPYESQFLPGGTHPALLDRVEINPAEAALLLKAVRGGNVLYSSGSRTDKARAKMLAQMAYSGLVLFTDHVEGGWEKGMWSAHATCNGLNALYRYHDDTHRNARDCNGTWRPDGTCARCGQDRPLDRAAYQAFLEALSPADREDETRTRPLWCREHGYLRRKNVTTKKVCMLAGTDRHDGALDRF